MKILLRQYLRKIGPGLITGASDDDPSGIVTYALSGARFGLSALWTALFTFPLMAAVQEACARIGLATGQGLAQAIKQRYGKTILYGSVLLLILANTINIGADLGAIADSIRLLIPKLPFGLLLVTVAVGTLLLEIFVSYRKYARYLKVLTVFLLAYIAVAFFIQIDWPSVLKAVVTPKVLNQEGYLMALVAILGTTISPYLFFWQASEEVEEKINDREELTGTTKEAVEEMRTDITSGMLFSNLVMFFIMVTAAVTFFASGLKDIQTAAQAAEMLKPLAGQYAYLLFALGIIGSGLLAVPILAGSASYAVAETLGIQEGLSLKFKQAHGFYGIIALATLAGLIVNFLGVDPLQALFYTAVANGLVAPFLLVIIYKLSTDPAVVGPWTGKKLSKSLLLLTILLMTVSAVALIISWL